MVGYCNGWSKVDANGNPDLGDDGANAVQTQMNEGRKQWDAKKREWLNPKKWADSLYRNWVDQQGPLKKSLIKRFGKEGERLVRELELSASGSAKGDVEYQRAYEKIFQKLSAREVEALNEMILAMRVIAISKNKKVVARNLLNDKTIGTVFDTENSKHIKALRKEFTKEQVDEMIKSNNRYLTVHKKSKEGSELAFKTHQLEGDAQTSAKKEMDDVIRNANILNPGGTTAEQHQAWLDKRKEIDSESFNKLEGFAKEYFSAMGQQLVYLRDAGLITEKSFKNMQAVGDYSPRRYIQFFDPDIRSDMLEAITTGSTQALEQDAALLMKDYMLKLHARIARNEANVALYEVAKENKDNGIVEVIDDEAKIADNFEAVSAWVDGKRYRMKMPLQYGKDWIGSDPVLSKNASKFFRTISGATFIRGLATGYNPEFALTNFPRDIVFSWFRTYEYASDVVRAPLQMARNLASTASDVWNMDKTPRGAGAAFLKEGGMMEFMTAQGQWFEKKFTKTTGASKVAGGLFDWLSYPGQKTELWVRLALREQAIRNRVDSATFAKYQAWLKTDMKTPSPIDPEIGREATWIARGYLDFSKGGRYTKAADTAMPYVNAAVLATTGMFSTFGGGTGSMTGKQRAQRIALATWKFAQFFSLAAALFWHNISENGDDWEKVDDRDKIGNLIIFSDYFDRTKEGQLSRGYFKIALDQGQSAVASLVGLMISSWARSQDHPAGSPLAKIGDIRPEFWREGIGKINPVTSFVPPTLKALLGIGNLDTYRMNSIWKGRELDDKGLEYTPYTHPAYRMSAEMLNKNFPTLGGLLPSKPFSPERLRYVVDTFFVPSSTFIRGVSYGMNEILRQTAGTEYEQTIQDSLITEKRQMFKAIPGLDRVFEMTPGENQEQRIRARQDKISGQTSIQRVDNKINLLLYNLNQSDAGGIERIRQELKKTIDNSDLPKKEKTRMRNKALDAYAFKRSAGNIPDPRFWRQVATAKSGEVRARLIFNAIKRRPEYADTLKETYRKLKRVSNQRTTLALLEMMKKDEQGIAQSWE